MLRKIECEAVKRSRNNDYNKKYYEQNKERLAEYRKEYRERNKEKAAIQKKEYYKQNKAELLAKQVEYQRMRMGTDLAFKFISVCRGRVRSYFKSKGIPKSQTTLEMLGCTPEQLRDHLQSQFTEGMTLENHGEWHIDHIIPLASAKTEAEIIKLCHYTNLQPLWAEDNLSKSDKLAA